MLIRLLRTYTKPFRARVILISVLVLIQAVIGLYLPRLNADIVNLGIVTGDIGYIWQVGGWMVLLTAISMAVAIWAAWHNAFVTMSFARDVRRDVFANVLGFTAREVDQFGTPSLITRNTNDVQQVQLLLSVLLSMLLSAPLTMIGGIALAVHTNPRMSLLIAVAIPAMAGVIGVMMKVAIPQFRVIQDRIDNINGILREQINGMRVIRAFVRDNFERDRFAVANAELRDTSLRINRIFALAMPVLTLILNFSTIGVVWFGGHLVDSGQMTIGDIGAFISYLMQILLSVMFATMAVVLIPRAAASAERIQAVLDVVPAIADPRDPQPQPTPGTVSFRNVTFRYPGAEEPVLRNISFDVNPGEFTAIVGGTGSGKTTVIGLLARFFDVSDGEVLVGGTDVRSQSLHTLYASIGLVPQRAYLFGGTIRENVMFGAPQLTDDEVWQILEIAQAADFVRELDAGLDHDVAQGGQNLSGGQRQRLAIARALALRPSIYVLDDSFSALDAATDARLRSALQREMHGSAVIVVAQRVSTVLHADRIIVLDDGVIAGIGTHDELLATCTAYKEIVGSQMGVNA